MKISRIILSAALATGASAAALAPTASATSDANVYVHGTTRVASFANRATCNRYAAAEVRRVTSHPTKARLLGAQPYYGYPSARQRLKCYPVQGARWSYVVAYQALSGKPLNRQDKLYPRLGVVTIDAENVWAFNHYRAYARVNTCQAAFRTALAQVEKASTRKLAFSTYPCMTFGPGTVAFTVAYFATTSGGGLTGDLPYGQTINMLNQNGWAVPYM